MQFRFELSHPIIIEEEDELYAWNMLAEKLQDISADEKEIKLGHPIFDIFTVTKQLKD